MRLAVIVHITGTLVRLFGPALLAPAMVAALYREWRDTAGFLVACAVTIAVGAAMRLAGGPAAGDVERLRRIEGMGIVAATWLVIAHLAAIPYVWAGLGPIDALPTSARWSLPSWWSPCFSSGTAWASATRCATARSRSCRF